MLEIYFSHLTNNFDSQNSTLETAPLKQFQHYTFVIQTNFEPVKITTKHEPLRIGPNKMRLMSHSNLLVKLVLQFTPTAIIFTLLS